MKAEMRDDPMFPVQDWQMKLTLARTAPRCEARNRAGGICQGPAMANGRCRFHGGKSTGPRTAEGLARMKAAKTRHGAYSAEAAEFRAWLRQMQAEARRLVELV